MNPQTTRPDPATEGLYFAAAYDGAQVERARIVAWLRKLADDMEREEVALISHDWGQQRWGRILGWREAADGIEQGKHEH